MKILIDNGHGRNTLGKCSPDGALKEWSYTREIASRVVGKLKGKGCDAERLVQELDDVSLPERVRRINEYCDKYGSQNVIVISIHCNAAGMGDWMDARGWCCYTSIGKTKADRIGECFYNAAKKHLSGVRIREDMSDGDPDFEAGFYLLKKTKCPAVLTENLFMDNKYDMVYLLSDEGRKAIVDVHVDAITQYLADE